VTQHHMQLKRTFELIDHCLSHYPNEDLLYRRRNGVWVPLTSNELSAQVNYLSAALLSEGIKNNENVATIFSYNSCEWNIIDLAIAQIGAVHLPVYPTISDSDYLFILNQAEIRTIFVSDQVIYNKISGLLRDLPILETIISIEKLSNVKYFEDLIIYGKEIFNSQKKQIAIRRKKIQAESVCSIIYTSGTTGFPKGVMLTHENLCTNLMAAASLQPVEKGEKVLSFLPLCHAYERMAVYQSLYKGIKVYYADSFKSILIDMRDVQPHGTTVVPRILEKIVKGVLTNAKESFLIKRWIMKWSVEFGFKYRIYKRKGFIRRFKLFLADKFVYRHVRALLGGKLKYVGCGGAPVIKEIERFFWAAGIPVYEGYGLTECSPLVALNYEGRNNVVVGTVGPVIPDVEVKIAADGEILVRGPNLMKGYYKNPELTEQTILDGWLHTGDLGRFLADRFLKIKGRKKEMFKTSYGKYIVPQAIESKFAESMIIDRIMIIGEGKHCAAAIVSPDFKYFREVFKMETDLGNIELVNSPELSGLIAKEISKVNRQLGKTEQIKKYFIVADNWTPESGEISATQKLKRNIILHKYSLHIHDLFKEDSFDE
jgi:long-chain acyl-CoA synthetase